MVRASQFPWFIFFLLASCSAALFDHSPSREEGEADQAESPSSRDQVEDEAVANEPVPIAGGFLVCVNPTAAEDSIACRIASPAREKLQLEGLQADDLIPFASNHQSLPKSFQLADEGDSWHWLLVEDSLVSQVAFVRLSDRFVADGGRAALESLIFKESEITLDEQSAGEGSIGPTPGPADMERTSDNRLVANDSYWYHGAESESCNDVCEDKGGFLEEVTAHWTRDLVFCSNLHRVMRPNTQLDRHFVVSDEIRGLGCYTDENEVGAIFLEESDLPLLASASANGVRRYCSCQN